MKGSAEGWGGKRGRRAGAWLCAGALLCVCARVQAETAVLLPHSGDPQLVAMREVCLLYTSPSPRDS